MKKADPAHDILVVERNRADDTFGFGVVFSDATLETFAEADPETYGEITRNFAHWDDIDIHYRGEVLTSTGHGFSGLSRQLLLDILQRRCAELGVRFRWETEVSDLGAWADADLRGHHLLKNRSLWRNFPTVKNACWHHRNLVLIGDAAHTAHFSIGSGTKLAMEDAIALRRALERHDEVDKALVAYEEERRPEVESLQRAAQVSLEWFEQTERYHGRLEPIQVAMSLLTRSLRVTHANLKVRDPKFVESVDRWFASRAEAQSRVTVPATPAPPPMFTPFRLRELVLANRVVCSPMCQYSAEGGTAEAWPRVHLGSRPT